MTSPLAKDLFQRMIGQSGSAISPPLRSLAEAEKANEKVIAGLKLAAGDEIRSLRERSAQELLEVAGRQDPQGLPVEGPIVDGWAIPRAPEEVFAAGQQAPVALLIGTTTREFGMQAPPDEVRKFI